MKLEYFDLVMMNCPTTPPPAPVEANPDEPNPDGDEDKQAPKRQSIKKGWAIL